jgi:hypothetical protein
MRPQQKRVFTENELDAIEKKKHLKKQLEDLSAPSYDEKRTLQRRHLRNSDVDYRKSCNRMRGKVTKVVNERTAKSAFRRGNEWSDYEDSFLVDNNDSMTYVQIAKHLHRTYCAIKCRVHILRSKGIISESVDDSASA